MIRFLVAAAVLAVNGYLYHYFATDEVVPVRESFVSFPMEIESWRCDERYTIPDDVMDVLGATDYMICDYERESQPGYVNVYVGYHESQVRKEGGGLSRSAIHTPNHCLPGSGWDVIASDRVNLDVDGLGDDATEVNRLVIAKGDARQLVYYWYQSRGHVISDDYRKIVHLFWDRATRNRTDGSLVRFTVPVIRGDEEGAEENLREVASLVVPLLPRYVPN